MTHPPLTPASVRQDITWQAGDDRPAVLPLLDADGSPRDASGWSALAVVVRHGRVLHRWSTDDGSAVCGPDGVSLLADDSDSWAWERGEYDLRVTGPGGREVAAHGVMVVRPLRSSDGSAP